MRKSLLKSFQGAKGRQHLIDALISQPLIADRDLALVVERRLKLEELPAGTILIEQNASDTDLFLILQGEFSIAIGRRIVARKKAGEHVGEMSVVDPRTPRSATVTASIDSVIARISETDFSELADKFPRMWRRIAAGLARRLRNQSASAHKREKAASAA